MTRIITLLLIFCSSGISFSQVKPIVTVITVPRSQTESNPSNFIFEKFNYENAVYYMMRFHNFHHNTNYLHPDMAPHCLHPRSYVERYYYFVYDEESYLDFVKAYNSNENHNLSFITEGYFDVTRSIGETSGVFLWPVKMSNASIANAIENPSSETIFNFDFDKKIKNFTPIHFKYFSGDVWLKGKKIEKFILSVGKKNSK